MKQLLITFLYGLGTILLSPVLALIYVLTQIIGLVFFVIDVILAIPRFVTGLGKKGKKDKYTLALEKAKLEAQTQAQPVAPQPSVVFIQQPMPQQMQQPYGYAPYPPQGQPMPQQGYNPYPQQPQGQQPPYNQVPPPNQWNGGKR